MVFMPVRAVTVAEPPRHNMEDTTMLVAKPKKRKTKWATLPHLPNMSVQDHATRDPNVPHSDNLEERVSIGCVQLELCSELGEEEHLNGGTATIPPGSTETSENIFAKERLSLP